MSKVFPLAQAVSTTVGEGATVLFAFTHNRSHAAAFEVARQFRDRRSLTLVDGDGSLKITGVMCETGAECDALAEMAQRCGNLPVSRNAGRVDPPAGPELALLRGFDPERVILA